MFLSKKFLFVFSFSLSMLRAEPLILNIETAIEIALCKNRTMADSIDKLRFANLNLEYQLSQFQTKITPRGETGYTGGGKRGSGMTIGGGIDIYRKFEDGTSFTLSPFLAKMANQYSLTLRTRLIRPLMKGYGKEYNLSSVYGSEFGLRTAKRNLCLAEINIMMRTVQALYEIQRQKETVAFEEASFERMSRFTEATKVKEGIGISDALDVYRAELELKQADESLQQARDRLADARDQVYDILSLSLEEEFDVEVPLEYEPLGMTIEEAIETAQANRIELDQVYDQYSESKRLSRLAKKNIRPEINVVLDYTTQSRDEMFTGAWTGKRENKWGIGFMTSTDFCMKQEKLAYEQSLLNVSATERAIDTTWKNIVLEIRRIFRGMRRSEQRIENQKDQIKKSEGQFNLSKAKFNRGLANNFDVIQAEKSIRAAKSGLINAVVEHILLEYKLLAACGLIVDKCSLYDE